MITTAPFRPSLAEVLLSLGENDIYMPRDAVPWALLHGTDWERALGECELGGFLPWVADALLLRGHLNHKAFVTVACACARSALHLVPVEEGRPRLAIEAAERWTRGEATPDDVQRAAADADDAAFARTAPVEAAAKAAAYAARCVIRAMATTAQSADAVQMFVERALRTAGEGSSAAAVARMRRQFAPVLVEGLVSYASTMPVPVPVPAGEDLRRPLADVLLGLQVYGLSTPESLAWAADCGPRWEEALAGQEEQALMAIIGNLVLRGHAPRKVFVLGLCACARLALPLVREGDERPRLALEAAERWARGEVVPLARVVTALDGVRDAIADIEGDRYVWTPPAHRPSLYATQAVWRAVAEACCAPDSSTAWASAAYTSVCFARRAAAELKARREPPADDEVLASELEDWVGRQGDAAVAIAREEVLAAMRAHFVPAIVKALEALEEKARREALRDAVRRRSGGLR